jgi:amino acid transporter
MRRWLFIAACVLASGASSYYGQPFLKDNPDAILILITTFTVFAGFLIAIIAIIGDPVLIRDGSWRVAEGGRDKMEQRLVWHIALFILYLITIGLLFAGSLLAKAFSHEDLWNVWVQRVYLFFGVTSFLFTFALPSMLMAMQRERYDAEIERRRKKEKITP